MEQRNRDVAALFGRALLAAVFVVSAVRKMGNFSGTAAIMENAGLPMVGWLLVLTIAIELGGGVMLVAGWHAQRAALLLLMFLVPVTAVFHNPWAGTDPALAHQQMIHFLKNLSIMGGLLGVFAFGPGGLSRDACKATAARLA